MDIKKNLKNPDIQYWPDVRWWLAEGFHTDETLKKEIADLHDSGFGARGISRHGRAWRRTPNSTAGVPRSGYTTPTRSSARPPNGIWGSA